jgi:hypothetical protein
LFAEHFNTKLNACLFFFPHVEDELLYICEPLSKYQLCVIFFTVDSTDQLFLSFINFLSIEFEVALSSYEGYFKMSIKTDSHYSDTTYIQLRSSLVGVELLINQ